MATLSLRVSVVGSNVVKTMQFDPGLQVFDACRIVRSKIPEANQGNGMSHFCRAMLCVSGDHCRRAMAGWLAGCHGLVLC